VIINPLDKLLLEKGFNALSIYEKNNIVVHLASEGGIGIETVTEEYVLNHHKKLKAEQLKEECEERILLGITASNGHVYRTNRDDQTNMLGRKEYLNDHPDAETVKWKTEDAGFVEHTREEWIKVFYECMQNKEALIYKYDVLKKAVMDATTHEEVLNIGKEEDVEETPTEEEVVPEEIDSEENVETPVEETQVEEENPTETPDDTV
jgi:hypothetical protein